MASSIIDIAQTIHAHVCILAGLEHPLSPTLNEEKYNKP
jgi:hypothetical protein